MPPLDVERVRDIATSQGWVEIQFNPVSRVIGFLRDDEVNADALRVDGQSCWLHNAFTGSVG